jgi:aminomethyltransferase
MTRQTPLNHIHREMGAKMVEFSGWDMPVHYGSQIEEHHAVRNHAGMFDVSHMTVVDARGPQTKAFFSHLLANDIGKLKKPGRALYSCMLNDSGGVIDDLIVYFMADDWYRVIVNAATRDKDLAWIAQQSASFDIEITQKSGIAMIAVQGPDACDLAQKVMPEALVDGAQKLGRFSAVSLGEWFVGRTGYTGEDGYELIMPAADGVEVWQALARLGVKPVGLGARDTLRLEAGMALYGSDLDENTSPLESGLAWTVAMQPAERNFSGRQALQTQLDNGLKSKMVGLMLEGRGIMRGHQNVMLNGDRVGEVTSGTYSPTIGATIALARVDIAVENHCEVDIRGKMVAARVVKYPFVKNGRFEKPPGD